MPKRGAASKLLRQRRTQLYRAKSLELPLPGAATCEGERRRQGQRRIVRTSIEGTSGKQLCKREHVSPQVANGPLPLCESNFAYNPSLSRE